MSSSRYRSAPARATIDCLTSEAEELERLVSPAPATLSAASRSKVPAKAPRRAKNCAARPRAARSSSRSRPGASAGVGASSPPSTSSSNRSVSRPDGRRAEHVGAGGGEFDGQGKPVEREADRGDVGGGVVDVEVGSTAAARSTNSATAACAVISAGARPVGRQVRGRHRPGELAGQRRPAGWWPAPDAGRRCSTRTRAGPDGDDCSHVSSTSSALLSGERSAIAWIGSSPGRGSRPPTWRTRRHHDDGSSIGPRSTYQTGLGPRPARSTRAGSCPHPPGR